MTSKPKYANIKRKMKKQTKKQVSSGSCYKKLQEFENRASSRKISQTLWLMLLKKHLKYSPNLMSKVSKIRWTKDGEMKEEGRAWKYTIKHFPSLIEKFNEWRNK